MKISWVLPAFLAVAFFLFTIWTMVKISQPFEFVLEHPHSLWGAQIALELINALFLGIYIAKVQSQQYRFRTWPYMLLTALTGSPGLLALAARVLYARNISNRSDRRLSQLAARASV
jgi:FtsH-binding integral membrane protein